MKYIVELDSSQRDVSLYPLSNDYIVSFDRPIYNVDMIDIVSALIPKSQPLINGGNKQFQIDSTNIILDEKNYSNGHQLASNIETSLSTTNVNSVTFNENTNKLLFSGPSDFTFKFDSGSNGYSSSSVIGPPAHVFGFNGRDVSSTGTQLESGSVDLTGTQSIIVKFTSGEDDIDRGLYTDNHVYFGKVLCREGDIIYHNGSHDPIRQEFFKSNRKDITSLRVRFYWNNGTKLVPYDFGNRNHILKIEISGNTDKFNSNPAEDLNAIKELPPAIEFPKLKSKMRDLSADKVIPVVLAVVLLLGLLSLANRTVKDNSTG